MPTPQPKPSQPATDKAAILTTLPRNWPLDITYLTHTSYSPHLTATTIANVQRPAASLPQNTPTHTLRPGPSRNVAILPINSPAHPAHGQSGLFAARDLAPDGFILCYLGRVHGNADEDAVADAESDYDLSLDRELGLGVDARFMGNEARFINDYRGVPVSAGALSVQSRSARPAQRNSRHADKRAAASGKASKVTTAKQAPNAEFRDVWVEVGGGLVEKRVGVFVLSAGRSGKRARGVKIGEEVLVSYGKGFWAERLGGGEAAAVEVEGEGVGVVT